jgi:hypothetical protein
MSDFFPFGSVNVYTYDSMSSSIKKILINLKKMKMPVNTVKKFIKGFSGAGKFRREYEEMIAESTPPVQSPSENAQGQSPQTQGPTTIALRNDMTNWNAEKHRRVKPTNDGVKVLLPKGGYSASGGVNIKFKPDGVKDAKSIKLEYEVFAPKKVDWVKGGKLGIGVNINNGSGGHSWKPNDGSFRLMFRRSGQLVGYLYLPTDQGEYIPEKTLCPLLKNQGKGFMEAIGHRAPSAGLDVFRWTKEKIYLKAGEFNKITIEAQLNTKGKNDGRLSIDLNGKKLSVDDMMWTGNPDKNMFTQLQLACWFGGGDKSWSAKKDEEFIIRNIKYTYSPQINSLP